MSTFRRMRLAAASSSTCCASSSLSMDEVFSASWTRSTGRYAGAAKSLLTSVVFIIASFRSCVLHSALLSSKGQHRRLVSASPPAVLDEGDKRTNERLKHAAFRPHPLHSQIPKSAPPPATVCMPVSPEPCISPHVFVVNGARASQGNALGEDRQSGRRNVTPWHRPLVVGWSRAK